ncbi:hypothetical protein BDR26DRAFT_921109 [Obelidium mucronatum]|nr:hypothetical protein BDR26DRAFT_921109 [Obelidium mucronatum]
MTKSVSTKHIAFAIFLASAFAFPLWHIYVTRPDVKVFEAKTQTDNTSSLSDKPIYQMDRIKPCRVRTNLTDFIFTANASSFGLFPSANSTPTSFTIVAVVQPRNNLGPGHWERYQMVPSLFPPDDLILSASSKTTHFRQSLRQCRLPSTSPTSSHVYEHSRIYESELELSVHGIYELSVRLEHRDYEWNPINSTHLKISSLKKVTLPLHIQANTTAKVYVPHTRSSINTNQISPHCNISSLYNSSALTNSSAEEAPFPFPLDSLFPGHWRLHTALLSNPRYNSTPWVTNQSPSKTGYLWLPSTDCTLRHFTPPASRKCLIKKYPVIHWYGDSNSRRAIKYLNMNKPWTTFVKGDTDAEICEDGRSGWFGDFHHGNRAVLIGENEGIANKNPEGEVELMSKSEKWKAAYAKIYFRSIGDSSTRNPFLWKDILDVGHPKNAVAESRRYNESVKLVIFSSGNWGAAFEQYATWAQELRKFAISLKTLYAHETGVRFVFRPAQPACSSRVFGHNRFEHRKYTHARNEMFRTTAAIIFKEELNADIWDVGPVNSDDLMCSSFDCPSNHAHPSIISMENQLLFNLLC